MEFILDTNAYRNLVENRNLQEIYSLSQAMIAAETQNNHTSAMSIVVAMELISRLENGDPAKERCYKALCLQFFHTRRRKLQGFGGSYYPPLNVILSQFFFGRNSKYHELYGRVIELVYKLTEYMDIKRCDVYANEIKAVKNQISFEKKEFQSNTESMLRSINNGKLNWQYFIKNKQERQQFKMKLTDGRMYILLGLALFKRAHQTVEIFGTSLSAASKLDSFFKIYKPALIMNASILASIADGSTWLGDINNSKWNTLNDVQIMFGLLYERPGFDKKLITDEGKIKSSCQQAGLGNLILSLNDYKTMNGLINI